MKTLYPNGRLALRVLVLAGLVAWAGPVHAYPQFSLSGGDATNCGACHGDFRQNNYVSLVDGQNWGNIHNLHRNTMLSGDCDTCHIGGSRFPVNLDASNGGAGLSAISCMGCHGRVEDDNAANPNFGGKLGAGLRQAHYNAGQTICQGCHADSNPANYTPFDERTLPPYYANPGSGHANMPTDACTVGGGEDFAGATQGLDNDGDGVRDGNDSDCVVPVEETTWGAIKALYHLD